MEDADSGDDDRSFPRSRLSPKGKKVKKLDKKTMLSKPFPVFGASHADDEDEMDERFCFSPFPHIFGQLLHHSSADY